MFQQSADAAPKLLIVALLVFAHDLSRGGRAQAWTYTYSTTPSRSWSDARQWCQQNFVDMVVVKNQEETDFLNNLLPYNLKHYWIGVQKRKADGAWVWHTTGQKVPTEAQNWAAQEPDMIEDNDCVEIYIKRDHDTAKWNNENCRRRKGTICYSASCTQGSCSVHAECIETIGNYTCQCHPGFWGSRCEDAITCKPLPKPEEGSLNCVNPYGPNRFNSSCVFHCELGFHLVGVPQLQCQASGQWTHPVPLCHVNQCQVLNHTISAGHMDCNHPVAPYSYNSTCEVRCNEGFELKGQDQIRCNHTGQWTATVPSCSVKKCPTILFPVTGNMTCVDTVEPFSFGSQCNFTCQEGYNLTGANTLTCLASGNWSGPIPTCTVVQCISLEAPPHASVQCRDPLGMYSYDSTCTVQCEEGFDLIGSNVMKCSSEGKWSNTLPVCQANRCPPLSSPPHGTLRCSHPHGEFSFGSQCTSTCEEGFILNGTADTDCTSLGTWSADIPRCSAKRCSALNASTHGSLRCSDPHGAFSFGSRCTSTCQEGFVLNGTADTECTSLGTWSRLMPRCLALPCPLLATAPRHGQMNCSHPYSSFSYSSHCDFECNEGFWLQGTSAMTCNTTGHWSQEVPTCQPVKCEALCALPLPLSMNCTHPLGSFSFGSRCTFTCKDGYSLNGTEEMICSYTGVWSDRLPTCTAEGVPVGTALLIYTSVGAGSVIVLLMLIGLVALIVKKRKKKQGNMMVSDEKAWEERENPAFEF